jgi:hypothetical protein
MTLDGDLELKSTSTQPPLDFSLVLGGPLFQLFRRAHLSGDTLDLLYRRILIITLFAWLPLLLLSLSEGHAFGGKLKIPFLHDIETHVRFLIALPALIAAELEVHDRTRSVIRRFLERHIVVPEDLPKFDAAIRFALRVRNSVVVELALLALTYSLGLWIRRSQLALGPPTWYAVPDATQLHLTGAGYWYTLISIPFFQFILIRWYMRLLLWFWLLWRISKLNLHLTAVHPDRAGGIGFLGKTSYAFALILFAQGALLSGLIANRVLYEGRNLLSFKMQAAGFVSFFVLFILGPLVVFTPLLSRARRAGNAEYGLLANQYAFGFEKKWIRGGAPDVGELLGTGDIQSLADLGNSCSVVSEMRIVPFGLQDITRLAAATAAPLLPLALIIFSPEQLLTQVAKIIF